MNKILDYVTRDSISLTSLACELVNIKKHTGITAELFCNSNIGKFSTFSKL